MAKKERKPAKSVEKVRCGIVMPISATAECPKAHWEDVLGIIQEALDEKFSAQLVSVADETRVIQARIIQSLYEDPIVVCDVSCRNPNVMFELGIRIAFDKPTVVIKDEVTEFSFDSSPLEHLIYPRSLSYKEICAFKLLLASKVQATLEKSKEADHQSFLKTFAPYVVAGRLDTKEVSESQFFTNKLDQILAELDSLRQAQRPRTKSGFPVESLFGQAEQYANPYPGTLDEVLAASAALYMNEKRVDVVTPKELYEFVKNMPVHERPKLTARSRFGFDRIVHMLKTHSQLEE